jgi:hypothetical protein
MVEMRNSYKIVVGKREGKRQKCIWEDISKMDLEEVSEAVEWIRLVLGKVW